MHSNKEFAFLSVVALALMVTLAGATTPAPAPKDPGTKSVAPHRHVGGVGQADRYYATIWGVDQLRLKKTSSGELIRFTYRVVDVDRAKAIHDKKAEPHLLDPRSHAILSVPSLENVGSLRQTEAIVKGKDYWVLFSNKGNLVQVGDRADIAIGDFYVSGLPVE